MPRVFIIPHVLDEGLLSDTAAMANDAQSDFRFHPLPPDNRDDSPLMAASSDFRPILQYLQDRKVALNAAPDDLIIAFYQGLLGAEEAGLTNLFVAGARYDEPTPCTAVVSLRFLAFDILEKGIDYSLQKHALLHLLLCCILGGYTHINAHAATHGCLLDFDARLSDFNRKLARGYYLCSPHENDCCRAVQREKYGNAIITLCSVLKYKTDQKTIQISIGQLVMGDLFNNVNNSTIINRSKVVNALNTIGNEIDDETKNALVEIANFVTKCGNPAAGAVFDQFNDELAKPQRDSSTLKKLWDGLITLLPDIAKLSSAVAKIGGGFCID